MPRTCQKVLWCLVGGWLGRPKNPIFVQIISNCSFSHCFLYSDSKMIKTFVNNTILRSPLLILNIQRKFLKIRRKNKMIIFLNFSEVKSIFRICPNRLFKSACITHTCHLTIFNPIQHVRKSHLFLLLRDKSITGSHPYDRTPLQDLTFIYSQLI